MRRFVTFLNTQLKISLRDMNMPIFALLMPLVIFLVLGILYGGKPACEGDEAISSSSWNSPSARSARWPSVQAA